VRELDLGRRALVGEGLLDDVELGGARHAVEADAHDLVERRVGLGEARHPARDGDQEAFGAGAGLGGPAGVGDEARLRPFDPTGERGVAEEG
jgi:hypothetical protein